jgi:hypothetical protein
MISLINGLMPRLCSNLFLSGASVTLGHTRKKDGIMDHTAYWARQYTPRLARGAGDRSTPTAKSLTSLPGQISLHQGEDKQESLKMI